MVPSSDRLTPRGYNIHIIVSRGQDLPFPLLLLEIQLGKLYDTSLVKQINNWLFQILVEDYNSRHIDRDVKKSHWQQYYSWSMHRLLIDIDSK